MYLWDVAIGKQVRKIDGLIDDVSSVVFCPDGKAFVSSHQDRDEGALRGRGLRLWDSATGKELRALNCTENVRGVYFSPNGKLLTGRVGSRFSRPSIWDMTEGKEYPLLRLSWKCRWGGFSPDSRLLVLDCADSEWALGLIEVVSGEVVRRLPGIHDGWVSAVAFSPDGKLMATGGGDSTVLIWDLTGRYGAAASRKSVDLKKCWTDLAGPDTTQAYTALWALAAVPEQSVPFLREKLHPLPPLGETQRQKVQQWLADLESDDFARRQQALKELWGLGPMASPALRAALKGRPSLEARRQIEQLLKETVGWPPERLRLMRAVMALEHMGTADARSLLEELARGAPQALVMREAQAALDHWNKCRGAR